MAGFNCIDIFENGFGSPRKVVVTEPVGTALPAEDTVAVNRTSCPTMDGLGVEVSLSVTGSESE